MSELVIPIGRKDHIQGNPDAKNVLVEYGDYQCPYCGMAYPILKRVQEKMGEKLKFVFRNFPITNIHPLAEMAAEAAEAAGAQGKYWEMHDSIYENQKSLGQQLIMEMAESLGLDMKKFVEDIVSRKFLSHIKTDFMGGVRSGVNGTPSLFINGKRYDGSVSESELMEALEGQPAEEPVSVFHSESNRG